MLKGPLDGTHVFAQDSDGILHYINGSGKYYTNRQDENRFRTEAGIRFSTDIKATCGEFESGDNNVIIAAANENDGGLVRYSFSTLSVTHQDISPKTKFTDVTDSVLEDADLGLCDAKS